MDLTDFSAIADEHAARLKAIDPLLPPPGNLPDDPDVTVLTAEERDSAALGVLSCEMTPGDAPGAQWRALVEHRMDLRLAGPDPGTALGRLLEKWQERLAAAGTARNDWETAAVVIRPSRDSTGAGELLRHGFAPVRVVAVRPAERHGRGPRQTPGVAVRTATRDDLTNVVDLLLELQHYDAQFGVATVRESTERALTAEVEEVLAQDEPPLWIAEVYGKALGVARVQLPPSSDWAKIYVDQRSHPKIGYLTSLNVAEQARSTGVGTALAAHAHQVFDTEGVDLALLHHALANPRSTPFWYAQGYRPLWTYWYRRPAVR
ncbi:GNAT family N-acetyltransferase [Amycolatopsis albispora]|uniref:Acetyltransferase n=1 Tax=Amycolatopsis albispora TaxID=1804986 RepID=A0A344LFC5_9PSEU|nr:GNAT family N-acetyltransferase [Amycolatopsis albispora]AXB46749.1 acetyltransferase [Amycolatopsis albispora]